MLHDTKCCTLFVFSDLQQEPSTNGLSRRPETGKNFLKKPKSSAKTARRGLRSRPDARGGHIQGGGEASAKRLLAGVTAQIANHLRRKLNQAKGHCADWVWGTGGSSR